MNRSARWLVLAMSVAAGSVVNANAVEEDVARLLQKLQSTEYDVRAEATQQLVEAGPDAIGAITEVAEGDDLEAAIRAVQILDQIYAQGDEATFLPAEKSLMHLASLERASVAARASRSLDVHYMLRERHAVARLEKMGVVVHRNDDATNIRFPMADHGRHRPVERVALAEDYSGGDEGIRELARLSKLQFLYYVPDVVPISKEAMDDLLQALPNLSVQVRGQAYLGVGGNGFNFGNVPGFMITQIKQGSSADNAGMQVNDIIIEFASEEIGDFDDLVAELKKHKPGEKVTAKVLRGGEPLELSVTLTGWK